jgi:hypothetical protein
MSEDNAESASVRGWTGSVLKKQQRDLKRFLSKVCFSLRYSFKCHTSLLKRLRDHSY